MHSQQRCWGSESESRLYLAALQDLGVCKGSVKVLQVDH